MGKRSQFEAADSSLGFYFQSSYSLVLLCRADDQGAVSIETIDDVELIGAGPPSLHQLKHSLGEPAKLSEKSDGLWKTIGNWLSLPDWTSFTFVFVTCAEISDACGLEGLTCPDQSRDISSAMKCLEKEALRVSQPRSARETSTTEHKATKHPEFAIRKEPCRRFLELSEEQRGHFLRNLTLVTSGFSARDVPEQVTDVALKMYPKEKRAAICERLIEWWDRRVAKSLLGQLSRRIDKGELLSKLSELHRELSAPMLPDDFRYKTLDSYDSELGGFMERQILLVNGGEARVLRAARDRWRARSQRNQWLEQSLTYAEQLDIFDNGLEEEWADRHEPMRHDSRNADDNAKCAKGLEILDWTFNIAPAEVSPFRNGIEIPYLVRGSLQQLAEELRVGWHPDFQELLNIDAPGGSSAEGET